MSDNDPVERSTDLDGHGHVPVLWNWTCAPSGAGMAWKEVRPRVPPVCSGPATPTLSMNAMHRNPHSRTTGAEAGGAFATRRSGFCGRPPGPVNHPVTPLTGSARGESDRGQTAEVSTPAACLGGSREPRYPRALSSVRAMQRLPRHRWRAARRRGGWRFLHRGRSVATASFDPSGRAAVTRRSARSE